MKSNNLIISNFGYLTIILAFLISIHLLITINSETNIMRKSLYNNNKDFNYLLKFNKTKTVKISKISEEKTEGTNKFFANFYYNIDILFRCGLAFFLGALISERKFINIGKI